MPTKDGIWRTTQASKRNRTMKTKKSKQSMKQCRKCKRMIHKNAGKCPFCRAAQSTTAGALATVIVISTLLGFGIWGRESCSPTLEFSPEVEAELKAQKAEQKVERVKLKAKKSNEELYSDRITAWVMAKIFLEKELVSPSTADYGGIWGGQGYPNNVVDLGKGRYRVHGWVDSENRFGGTLRTNFACFLFYVGNNKWECEWISIDTR